MKTIEACAARSSGPRTSPIIRLLTLLAGSGGGLVGSLAFRAFVANLACLAVVAAAQAQPTDDADAQLRIRQAASAVSTATQEVGSLSQALDAERRRVVQTNEEREINQATIADLDSKLAAAKARLAERQAALRVAQEARNRLAPAPSPSAPPPTRPAAVAPAPSPQATPPAQPRAAAPPAMSVDCGGGNWCPKGNVCLLGGQCGRLVDVVPGSVRMANGNYCDPGWREHRYRPGTCVAPGYVDCSNGAMCPPPNAQCGEGGQCVGGPPATGPMCGSLQCAEGRICSSTGRCMNPAILQDCGNGSVCSRHAACLQPSGCGYVAPERTRQQR